MKSYLEISITMSEGERELLIPAMVELGCGGFQETDTSLLCYFDQTGWNKGNHAAIESGLNKILETIHTNAAVQFREFSEENWNEQWERTLRPVEVGERLVVKPTWCTYSGPSNRIIIEIDPKMSFGTGYHESTRLALRSLEQYLQPGMNVLDVGTGTGILAIAAAKLGASASTGMDIDDWSIENATENVLRNKVQDLVAISKSPLQQLTSRSFNLITANLTLNTIVDYLDEFGRLLTVNGVALLSGLLEQDRDSMAQALDKKNFTVIDELSENEWIGLVTRINA
ncbi:MAG TPA: 50S ribosomal protein L11 methyltransferase [Bacteroidota bacterium]|jgi:ribosomal protein L11 methyltransferase|nr:50S ribosomal protein L11 methyltransferase [Bacteroidota bacterium]